MIVMKSMLIPALLAVGFASYAQNNTMQLASPNIKLIAVVNRANWCRVCTANGERFASVLYPYEAKGVIILVNDLTNDSTIAFSKTELEKADVYNAVYSIKRKGVGRMMQSCGLAKRKKQEVVPSGIVTFINPQTHKQLKQMNIAASNEEMKTTIDNFLN